MIPDIRLPRQVVAGVVTRWPSRAPRWCAAVEQELADLCARYGARPTSVMNARFSYVVAVESRSASLVIRSTPDPTGPFQGRVATALADIGAAPRIHEIIETESGTWTVMERVHPGTPLADLDPSDSIVGTAAALLRRLAGRPAPTPEMPTIHEWLRPRLRAGGDLNDLPPGQRPVSAERRHEALGILDDLVGVDTSGLCHGDTSPWNLLLRGPDQLMLVDPRGVAGEVAYDVAVLALKATDAPPMVGAACLAKRVGISTERAQAWVTVANAARV